MHHTYKMHHQIAGSCRVLATAVADWSENLLGLALVQAYTYEFPIWLGLTRMSYYMYNSIIISDSDRTITYQIEVRNPRPCCVSLLEWAHKLFGSSLCPQPNAVII
jgi:hypothetical protein